MEIALDYCQRLSTHQAEVWISTFADIEDISDADIDAFQEAQNSNMAKSEPYCAVLEDCVVTEFQNAELCRPPVCPFQNDVACRYLTACLTEQLQTEYAIAMGFLDAAPGSSSSGASSAGGGAAAAAAADRAGTASTGSTSSGDPGAAAASAGWGV
jgi:hypothetical protein